MSIIRSESDRRKYRFIELSNGLKVMLVSSADVPPDTKTVRRTGRPVDVKPSKAAPTRLAGPRANTPLVEDPFIRSEKLAAAALVVKVGSFQDPPYLPGLAHFVDHMLLLGSEKYPREGEYLEFLLKNGGCINATTAVNITMYRFDVSEPAFPKGLDMFANFFIKPLLREDAIEREVHAVESEFQLEQMSDARRSKEVLARLAGSDHPMGRFIWGNLKTLRDIPREKKINMRNELMNFFNSYYSADAMTLCVQSNHKLEELEQFVRASFSLIPKKKRTPIVYPADLPFSNRPDFRKLCKVIPINRVNAITISWILPSQIQRYTTRSLDYLLYAVGHGGKNGLTDHLQRKKWAFEVCTGPILDGFDSNEMCAIFSIQIMLSDQGADNVASVLRLVHQYMHMLRKRGPQRWLWDELQYMADLEFRYQREEDPSDYVCRVSKQMQFFKREHYLSGDDLYLEFDGANIQSLMDAMTPESCNVMLLDSRFQKHLDKFPQSESWMGTRYRVEDFGSEFTKLWKDDPEFQRQLELPEPNRYRPTDMSIKEELAYTTDLSPVVIIDRPRGRLWYHKDQKFLQPRANFSIHLITMLPYMTIEGAICIEIMSHILNHQLYQTNSYAGMACIATDINGFNWGTTISVTGFGHRLAVVLDALLDALLKFDVSDDLFHVTKQKLANFYHNRVLTNGRLGYEVCSAVVHRSTTIDKRREALRPITKYDVIHIVGRLCATAYIEAYAHGNMTSVEAREIYMKLESRFSSTPLDRRMTMQTPVISGETYVRCLGINPEDRSSRIVNYYIYGPSHFFEETMMQMLVKLMEPHCIIELRTKQQFGYDACCTMYNCSGVIGFIISVSPSASRFTLTYVDEKIDDFLENMVKMIGELSQKEFDMVRDALYRAKQRTDLSIEYEQKRHWEQIVQFEYAFDQVKYEVDFLRTLELDRFRRWALRVLPMKGRDRQKFSVQIVGNGKAAIEECLGGDEIWKSRERRDDRRVPVDCELPIPPVQTIAPKDTGQKLFVRDFETYLACCEYYPPYRRDPRARIDF